MGPYPPGSNKIRRFIVLTDEIEEKNPKVAWVYLSTSMRDTTVVLDAKCHPAVTASCCVVYPVAQVVEVAAIEAAVQGGALVQAKTAFSGALLGEIQEGVFASEDTPTSVVTFCIDRI